MTLDKIIYLSGLVGRVQYILYCVLGLLTVIVFFNLFAGMVEYDYGNKAPYYFREMRKYIKRALAIALLVAVIPSKWEMLSMTITKGYKVDTIYQMTKEELKDNIDYLVNNLEKISDKND